MNLDFAAIAYRAIRDRIREPKTPKSTSKPSPIPLRD